MLDILVTIFKCLFTILGIVAVLSLLVCFITAPIENRRKKKELKEAKEKFNTTLKELSDKMADALIKEMEKEKQAEAKATAPKTRKPRKTTKTEEK